MKEEILKIKEETVGLINNASDLKSLEDIRVKVLGKKGDLSSRREALKYIYKKDVVNTLFEEIAPVYADRQGGYTRILKLRPRRGDGSEMCILELVDYTKKESSNEKETVKADK